MRSFLDRRVDLSSMRTISDHQVKEQQANCKAMLGKKQRPVAARETEKSSRFASDHRSLLFQKRHWPARILLAATTLLWSFLLNDARAAEPSVAELVAQLSPEQTLAERRAAAYQLGRLGPQAAAAVPVLAQAMTDKDLELCWYAVNALGRIGPAAQSVAPAIEREIRNPANLKIFPIVGITALGNIGPQATTSTELLSEMLTHDDARRRVAAALALWKIDRRPRGRAGLIKALQSDDEEIVFLACLGLWQVEPVPETLRPLTTLLGHRSADVRRVAARLVGRFGNAALEPVLEAVDAKSGATEQQVLATVTALGYVADQTRQTVFYRPETSRNELIRVARELLRTAVPWLVSRLSADDPLTRRIAARSLAKLGPLAMRSLLQAAAQENAVRQAAAIDALGQLEAYLPPPSLNSPGLEAAKPRLASAVLVALQHPNRETQAAAIRLLAVYPLGSPAAKAVPYLRTALKDERIDVRRDAAQALRNLDF